VVQGRGGKNGTHWGPFGRTQNQKSPVGKGKRVDQQSFCWERHVTGMQGRWAIPRTNPNGNEGPAQEKGRTSTNVKEGGSKQKDQPGGTWIRGRIKTRQEERLLDRGRESNALLRA